MLCFLFLGVSASGQSAGGSLPADFIDISTSSTSFACGDCTYNLVVVFSQACNGSGRVNFGIVPDFLTCTVEDLQIEVTNTDLILEQYTGSTSEVGYNIGGEVTTGETFSVNATFLNNSGTVCSSSPQTFTVHAAQGVHIMKTIDCSEEANLGDFIQSIASAQPASDYPVILGSNLNVNVDYSNIGRNWHIIPGVGIRQSSGTNLLFDNSILDVTPPPSMGQDAPSCLRMRNGIQTPTWVGSSSVINCQINHAAVGVYVPAGGTNNINVSVSNSTFFQNYVGVLTQFNDAAHNIAQNTFTASNLYQLEECTFTYLQETGIYINRCGRGYSGIVARGLRSP